MSIRDTYHSLRREVAVNFRNKRGVTSGAPSHDDYQRADDRINEMTHTELLILLGAYE